MRGSTPGCRVQLRPQESVAAEVPKKLQHSSSENGNCYGRSRVFWIWNLFGAGDLEIGALSRYGVAAAVAAGEAAGAGEPKLKFTVGAFLAPCCAAKNGRGVKPNMPAIIFVGKRFTATL